MTATAAAQRTLAGLIGEVGGPVACLAASRDPNAKLTVLIFPPGARRPAYAAKVPTTDEAARRVERETARLSEIAAGGLGQVSPTVPEVVATVRHLGRPVLVTSAMGGRSMLAAYHGWRHTARRAAVAADFAAAADWLAGLHRATACGQASLAAMLDGVAEAVGRRFAGRPGAGDDVARIGRLRGRMAAHRVPRTVVHGDYWPGNLLVSGGRVRGVVDWEAASASGVAARDVARFVVTYSLYLDRHTRDGRPVPGHRGLRAGAWGSGVAYAVDGTGWYPEMAREFVAGALRRLGTPASCTRDVLLADLAAIAAEADHDDFAWQHLLLFRRLYREGPP